MKVVINKCYGGFGLSQEALRWLVEQRGWTLDEVKTSEEWNKSKAQIVDTSGLGRERLWGPLTLCRVGEGELACRTNPDIVAVVETLGEKADGDYSSLKVVEVPDGIEIEIKEYDGQEWVAETHETWG